MPLSAERGRAESAAEDWFAAEIRPHEGALRRYLGGKFPGRGDVDDLIQETYLRLWRARQAGRATLTRAYLFVVARNVALDRIRHESKIAHTPLAEAEQAEVASDDTHAAEILSQAQELTLLRQAIQSLPPRCAEIVRLHWIEGHSYREVASRLEISESTVNTQLALGLIRCRRFLSLHGVSRVGLPTRFSAASHSS